MTNKELEVKVNAIENRLDALTPQLDALQELTDMINDEKSDNSNRGPDHQTQPETHLENRKKHTYVALAVVVLTFAAIAFGNVPFEFQIGKFRIGTDQTQRVDPAPNPPPGPKIDPDDQEKTPQPVAGIEVETRRAATAVEKSPTFEDEKKKLKSLYHDVAKLIRSNEIQSPQAARTAMTQAVSQSISLDVQDRWDRFFESIKTVLERELGNTEDTNKIATAYEQIAKGLN